MSVLLWCVEACRGLGNERWRRDVVGLDWWELLLVLVEIQLNMLGCLVVVY